MSYAALAGESDVVEGDRCPGKYEVWACKPDGTCTFKWCADSCPAPWESDVWMDTGQKTCNMPWTDYEAMLAAKQADSSAPASNGELERAGTDVALWAVAALVVVGGALWYASA